MMSLLESNRHGTLPHGVASRLVVPMLRLDIEVCAAHRAESATVLAAQQLGRQLLGDEVARPAAHVENGGRHVALFVLFFMLPLPVAHVLDPLRLDGHVGVAETALARADHLGLELGSQGDVAADAAAVSNRSTEPSGTS